MANKFSTDSNIKSDGNGPFRGGALESWGRAPVELAAPTGTPFVAQATSFSFPIEAGKAVRRAYIMDLLICENDRQRGRKSVELMEARFLGQTAAATI